MMMLDLAGTFARLLRTGVGTALQHATLGPRRRGWSWRDECMARFIQGEFTGVPADPVILRRRMEAMALPPDAMAKTLRPLTVDDPWLPLMDALAPLLARDLTEAAKKERSRRQALSTVRRGRSVRVFTNSDLERYQRADVSPGPPLSGKRRPVKPLRDLAKERKHWQKEKEKHQRERARLDARIRRLEWRLADRRARKRPGERLREDPAEKALEESLKSMRAERKRFIEEFRERGRKAGAFPGWLR